jgi:TPP-dependent pyruvate/acetoin dehydrogenase alpha subunit
MYLEKISLLEINEENATATALNDYYLVCLSRQLSLLGRKEVHNGRAHFGIFGDGKELAQVAFAKTFRKGDWRSGYYRDQTFMLALDLLKPEEFFAMIYGDTDVDFNPSTGGRNFNNHFSTSNINSDGQIQNLMEQFNSASDISPTAGQMPRLLGLAQASKLVRQNPELKKHLQNNVDGNEVAFGSIGDASTSEGMFFETINAAAVMQVPLAVAVYDDGFGISVPIELQTTKSSISKALKGFENDHGSNGISIYTCKGWDYPKLVQTFAEGIDRCRQNQNPVLFHIQEVTQPLGHSTSGSHEHYKSKKQLDWEKEFDCVAQFRKWLLETGKADQDALLEIENIATKTALNARNKAWKNYTNSFSAELKSLTAIVNQINLKSTGKSNYIDELEVLTAKTFPTRRAFYSFAKRIAFEIHGLKDLADERNDLLDWSGKFGEQNRQFYNTNLYREGKDSALRIKGISIEYQEDPLQVNGSQILNQNFDALFEKHPNLVTFGEDTGKLGDVNQGMKGMQAKYGISRVFDTGIRETTIIGQGIGLALRGFRPIAEIQYLDYLI